MTNVWAIYAFGVLLQDDYAPVAVFAKRDDADAVAKASYPGISAVIERTMTQVMDDLLNARLTSLGLKLDIVPAA